MATLSVLATEYVKSRVTATVGCVAYNPTGDVVEVAFPAPGVSPTVWSVGSWETCGTTYYARILVGPAGTVTLPVGTYTMWLRITDAPEIPVMEAGTLRIY